MKLFVKRLALKPDESSYCFVEEEVDLTTLLGIVIELDGGRRLTLKQVEHENGPNDISIYGEETLAVKPRASNFIILYATKYGRGGEV